MKLWLFVRSELLDVLGTIGEIFSNTRAECVPIPSSLTRISGCEDGWGLYLGYDIRDSEDEDQSGHSAKDRTAESC
jgi:hypothetical protein